jgi:Glutaminase
MPKSPPNPPCVNPGDTQRTNATAANCVGGGGPLTAAQANDLFREMAAQQSAIPFDYPDDCCYSRAHEMCRQLRARGIPCGKVWNYGSGGHEHPSLHATTTNHPSGSVTWWYHVAPTVPVQGSDGVVRDMVIDPSLFDHPVTVEEWVRRQQDPQSRTEQTDASPYFRGQGGNPRQCDNDGSKARSMLAAHGRRRDMRRAAGF